ncbi:hypothetical protein GCM10008932_08420 [Alkalibacterium iburiense]|uniref:C4-dicarboxylate ABC transporter n=1 Tax=Alkalibacterium iburiense TaxID=290589 RepID=A0ABN0X9H6_9LACT
MNEKVGAVLGWVAILAAVVGFFWQPYIMGGAAIVLGIVGYFMKANITRMSITAVGLGVVAILFGSVTY